MHLINKHIFNNANLKPHCYYIATILAASLFIPIMCVSADSYDWTIPPAYESQEKSGSFSVLDENGKSSDVYSSSNAILIIQGAYEKKHPAAFEDVSKTASKAEHILRPALERRGFHVVVWRDLKTTELVTAIRESLTYLGDDQWGRLFFYYYGHGVQVRDGGAESSQLAPYIVPVDAPSHTNNPKNFRARAMPIREVIALAQTADSKHMFFAFEACKAGDIVSFLGPTDGPNMSPNYILTQQVHAPIKQFITAGGVGQEVPAEGLFTQELVNAFSSPIYDANKDGYITGKELELLLPQRVEDMSRHNSRYQEIHFVQHPEIRTDPHQGGGDFIFGPIDPDGKQAISHEQIKLNRPDRKKVSNLPIKVLEELPKFHFGMSMAEVNGLLRNPFGEVEWQNLPIAGEYPNEEVRYFWKHLREFKSSELPFSNFYGACLDGTSNIAFFFTKNTGLFRVSLRLYPDCPIDIRSTSIKKVAAQYGVQTVSYNGYPTFQIEAEDALLIGVGGELVSSYEFEKLSPRAKGQIW